MSQITEDTMDLANKLMHAYRHHTIDLMANLASAMNNLKISVNDSEGQPHDIVLLEDVLGMLETVKESLSKYDVETDSEGLNSDG